MITSEVTETVPPAEIATELRLRSDPDVPTSPSTMGSPELSTRRNQVAVPATVEVSSAIAEAVNYYKETGTDNTSTAISNHDDWTNLPITPNGGNITIAPAAGGVFSVTPT